MFLIVGLDSAYSVPMPQQRSPSRQEKSEGKGSRLGKTGFQPDDGYGSKGYAVRNSGGKVGTEVGKIKRGQEFACSGNNCPHFGHGRIRFGERTGFPDVYLIPLQILCRVQGCRVAVCRRRIPGKGLRGRSSALPRPAAASRKRSQEYTCRNGSEQLFSKVAQNAPPIEVNGQRARDVPQDGSFIISRLHMP